MARDKPAVAGCSSARYPWAIMNARTRIVLALLGCLVFGGNALAIDLGHCDPLCCDEPCESRPLLPESCACCAVRSAAEADPMLPACAPAAPQPVALAAAPDLSRLRALTCPAALPVASTPLPPLARARVLRL